MQRRFHVLNLQQNDQALGVDLLRAAGNQWAKKAEYIMFTSFGKISIHRLMARTNEFLPGHQLY